MDCNLPVGFQQDQTSCICAPQAPSVLLDYSENVLPIWLLTDGFISSVTGVIAQGAEHISAKIMVFFSVKLSPQQANYSVHELEMLAGVEVMCHHCDILLGCTFY